MSKVAYGSLPFAEQIAFFRAKRGVLTESYLDVFGAEHDTAFMVAGANRNDLLADLRAAIDRSIADGATLEEFRQQFDAIADRYGWSYKGGRNWRTRVIYETNLRQSYNAGRWAQLQRRKRDMPYWEYKHSDAVEHPRPQHQAWNGLILHADDPWWRTHFPSNGWGCQCSVQALSERDLKNRGKSGPDQAPPIEWDTVTIGQRSPSGPREVRTPRGIDPGFAYAPGRSLGGGAMPPIPRTPPSLAGQLEQTAQHVLATASRLPAIEAARSASQILALPRAAAAIDDGYAAWQSELMLTRQPQNFAYMVGAIDDQVLAPLAALSVEPSTAPILARDVEVLHTVRDAKALDSLITARAVTAAELSHLPAMLRTYRAVLLQVHDRRLIYVVDAQRRDVVKIAVAIDYRLKLQGGRQQVNSFRSAGLVDLVDIRAAVNAGDLRLLLGSID